MLERWVKLAMQTNTLRRLSFKGCHLLWVGLLLSLTGLMACAGSGVSYNGNLAKPESSYPLTRGDINELKWQTNDIFINAMYALEDDQLDLAGRLQLQDRLAHYPVVDFLRVNVHALDGDGIILATYPLWNAPNRYELFYINWDFQQSYAVPDTTRAVTFSYRGRMSDGGGLGGTLGGLGSDGISWDFWHTP